MDEVEKNEEGGILLKWLVSALLLAAIVGVLAAEFVLDPSVYRRALNLHQLVAHNYPELNTMYKVVSVHGNQLILLSGSEKEFALNEIRFAIGDKAWTPKPNSLMELQRDKDHDGFFKVNNPCLECIPRGEPAK